MASASQTPNQEPEGLLDEIASLAASIARDAARLNETLTNYDPAFCPRAFNSPGANDRRNPAIVRKRDAAAIAIYLRARRRREAHFPKGIFSDPAWDILLNLFQASAEGRQVSVSNASDAANVPTTTAIRWITSLESRGLVEREKDPQDGRRVWVRITLEGQNGVNKWLDDISPLTERNAK